MKQCSRASLGSNPGSLATDSEVLTSLFGATLPSTELGGGKGRVCW